MGKEETIKLDQESGVARDQSRNLNEIRESSLVNFHIVRHSTLDAFSIERSFICLPPRINGKLVRAKQLETNEVFAFPPCPPLESSFDYRSLIIRAERLLPSAFTKLHRFKKVVNDMN